jgi:hypothetical protein
LPKKIELVLRKRKTLAVAELLEDKAPKTCAAVWRLLRNPLESMAIHAIRAGREVYCEMPQEKTKIPQENLTAYPLPGEILYLYFPPYMNPDRPKGLTEIAIFYGRDSMSDCIGMGIIPGNRFAHIVENLHGFAEACERIHLEGIERILIRRG